MMKSNCFASSAVAAIAVLALASVNVQGSIIVLDTDSATTPASHNDNNSNDGDFTFNNGIYTYAYNAGADSDMLVIAMSTEKSSEPFTVSYAGTSMTSAVASSVGSGASIWYLANPSASGDIVIDWSSVTVRNGLAIGIASLDGDGLEIGLHTTGVNNGSDEVDITTTIADSFIMVSGNANTTSGNPTMDSPLTTIYTVQDHGSSQGGAGYENSVAVGTHSYSWSPTNSPRGMAAASFVTIIPEPSSMAIFGMGLACCLLLRRRK